VSASFRPKERLPPFSYKEATLLKAALKMLPLGIRTLAGVVNLGTAVKVHMKGVRTIELEADLTDDMRHRLEEVGAWSILEAGAQAAWLRRQAEGGTAGGRPNGGPGYR
jgi:hypothetical protein